MNGTRTWPLAAALLSVSVAVATHGPGYAQPAPALAPAGALACVFDRLESKDRDLIGASVLGGEPGDTSSKAAAQKLDAAVQGCIAAHGWDSRRAGLSGAYAMNRSVYDLLERDFAQAGLAPGKLKILWTTLSDEDRAALRAPDLPEAVTERLVAQLKTIGVPNNVSDLLEAYSSLSALAEVAAIEAAWAAP